MEFVEGVNLAQRHPAEGAAAGGQRCHFIRQAALGLQHAFEKSMVHRDIKPHNLMLTPTGKVKILDFGLVRVRGEHKAGTRLTRLESFLGTPEYVAPEQAMDAREADSGPTSTAWEVRCTLC